MTAVHVYVSIDGRDLLAGSWFRHHRRGHESATFTYSAAYLSDPRAYALDPALPLTSGAFQTRPDQAIFGAFSDGAPDRWGRTLVQRRERALARAEQRTPRRLGAGDFVLGVRDDLRQGALRFTVDGTTFLADEDSGVPALTDLPRLMDLAARAERDTADLDDLERLIRVGSSLGGARPKAHVVDGTGLLAIAKFPSVDDGTWNVMAWEKVALDLAAAAGIDVPASKLLRLAGRSVLLVDRFDRTRAGARVGYASAMTMLEAADGDQRTYVEIAEIIEATSARATLELAELWRRLLFSVLISNTDDHLRNHGFLKGRGDVWSLSPAFDLNPNPEPGPKYLSTAIDSGEDRASVHAALAVAGVFRLTDDEARRILFQVAGAVSRWTALAERHHLGSADVRAMEPAFAALREVDGV